MQNTNQKQLHRIITSAVHEYDPGISLSPDLVDHIADRIARKLPENTKVHGIHTCTAADILQYIDSLPEAPPDELISERPTVESREAVRLSDKQSANTAVRLSGKAPKPAALLIAAFIVMLATIITLITLQTIWGP